MPTTIDISAWLDQRRVSALQMVVFVLCFLLVALDGYDAQIIGFAAPSIIHDFHIARGQMGPIFASGLFGLLVGCLAIAPLADWLGRKRVLVGSAILFGVFTLATAGAHSLSGLLWLRLLAGLGLGGSMPNAIALTAEYFPQRNRATATMAMFVGFPVGATLGGLLAAPLIPAHGWQVVFIIGGVLPLVMAGVLAAALPDSIRHLAAQGSGGVAQLRHLLRRMDRSAALPDGAVFVVAEPPVAGFTLPHLFRDGRALGTILLWVMFFMSLLDIFFIASWLPTVLHDSGVSLEAAVAATAVVQAGGVVSSLVVGRIADRRGYFLVLIPMYLLATVAIALLGRPGMSTSVLFLAAFVSGAGIVGGQTAVNVLAAVFYPTAMRATGVGWALGIGRIGSIVGPVVGGILLGFQWGNSGLFLMAAVPAFIAACAAIIMRQTSGKRLGVAKGGPVVLSH